MNGYRRGAFRGAAWWKGVDDLAPKVSLDDVPENHYQRANWVTWHNLGRPMNRGMVKVLHDGTVFWSRGTHECDGCHGPLRQTKLLHRFHKSQDGTVWTGWGCSGPSLVPMEEWR